MTSRPNIAGIYTDTTEHIHCDERSCVRAEVMLVQCAEGWRWGFGLWTEARILYSRPNVDRRPWPTRQQAIDSALAVLRGLADELVPCSPDAQLELFT